MLHQAVLSEQDANMLVRDVLKKFLNSERFQKVILWLATELKKSTDNMGIFILYGVHPLKYLYK
jgi:hypothetical protein